MKTNTMVTITRQYGSGGREIADLVAKKMGVRRYDRKVVAMAAEKLGDETNFHDLIERSYNAPDNCLGNLGDYAYERVPQHNRMYIEQAKVILGIAREGSAVFLGRCADYILQNAGHVTLNVFIHAPLNWRADYILNRYGETEVSIQKRLEKKDRSRRLYYNYYTDREWGDYRNYHLALDSAMLGRDTCVRLILQAAERLNQRVF